MRLPDAAATVAGYKMTRDGGSNAPLTWSLEGSTDGTAWTMLDDKRIWDLTDADQLEAAKAAVPAQKAEYNGGVPYRLASLTGTSLAPFGALTPVAVAAGATYAASDPTTRLDALSVDLAYALGSDPRSPIVLFIFVNAVKTARAPTFRPRLCTA